MKKSLLLLTVAALLALPSLAKAQDDSTNAPPPGPPPGGPGGPGGHHHMDFLTADEKAELKKAHEAALAADPSLAAEDAKMKATMEATRDSGERPTRDEMEAMKAFHEKLDAAMIKADPAVEPIIEKIKAHHPHGPGGPGGPGGPPPPDTDKDSDTDKSNN